MAKTLGIAQVLELTSKEKARAAKVKFLQDNFSSTLNDILILALHPAVRFLLPVGAPPYNVNDVTDQEFMLLREVKKLYLFVDGGGNHLTQMKREQMFMSLLENLAPKDAELIICVKDKTLPYGIDYDLVKEAFPNMLPDKEA